MKIIVRGRRWFRRGPGTTYHSVSIIVDGKEVEGVAYAYGYGSAYLDSACDQLEKLGLVWDREPHESLWRWAERVGVELDYSAEDVARKMDL